MSIYAIGDIQGCYDTLRRLLDHIAFHPDNDTLWFTGDLVNRGPHSLETLRFIKSLSNSAITVLGNHDLMLIALYYHAITPDEPHTLNTILNAPDADELINWLRQQPVLHYAHQYALVHAGIPPMWDLTTAQACARMLENTLQSDDCVYFCKHMYGNLPDIWSEDLTGFHKLRFIANGFTRMRLWNTDTDALVLEPKESMPNDTHVPWFEAPTRKTDNIHILFGHWAALEGHTNNARVHALDTGAVWGQYLTAFCLETQTKYRVAAI